MIKLTVLHSRLFAELIGTFLFVLTIPLASIGVGAMSAIPIGFMLSAMTFCFGYDSGAHFNPAITLAVFFIGKMTPIRVAMYMGIQTLASVLASLYAAIIVGVDMPAPTALSLAAVWRTVLTESVFSFAVETRRSGSRSGPPHWEFEKLPPHSTEWPCALALRSRSASSAGELGERLGILNLQV